MLEKVEGLSSKCYGLAEKEWDRAAISGEGITKEYELWTLLTHALENAYEAGHDLLAGRK